MNLRAFKLLYQSWWRGKAPKPPFRHIVQLGDPVLRQKSEPVDPAQIKEKPFQLLLASLYHLMKDTGALGLSAPQVGVPLRVFAIQCPTKSKFEPASLYDSRHMEYIPLQVWINPVMKVLDYTKITSEEGCESMKCFSAETTRFSRVLLTGLDHEGKEKNFEAKGWSARIIQHEMDHLEGKFFTDIMEPRSLIFSHWQMVNFKEGRIYITYMPNK